MIKQRLELNYKRLLGDEYALKNVFQPQDYAWAGDWEGRAILAKVSLWKATAVKPDDLDAIVDALPLYTNQFGYFGKVFDGKALEEQQLSGNSWFLRGLCEYYEMTKSSLVYDRLLSIEKNLIHKLDTLFLNYPIYDGIRNNSGEVSGESYGEVVDGWIISTDVGCAFVSIDGVSHLYKLTRNEETKKVLEVMIKKFLQIDLIKLKLQTHATLTAARGILRFYECTNEKSYLDSVIKIFELYKVAGMTLNYENFNWFTRPVWTEPCGIVDSIILAFKLFSMTSEIDYLHIAQRIIYNGLNFAQRCNGGAGVDLCALTNNPIVGLDTNLYEAVFCCTMRLGEGAFALKDFQARDSIEKNEISVLILDDLEKTFLKGQVDIKAETLYPYGNVISFKIKCRSPFKLKIYQPRGMKLTKVDCDYKIVDGFIQFDIQTSTEITINYEILQHTEVFDDKKMYFFGDLILGQIVSKEKEIIEKCQPKFVKVLDDKKLYPLYNLIDLNYDLSIILRQRILF